MYSQQATAAVKAFIKHALACTLACMLSVAIGNIELLTKAVVVEGRSFLGQC